MFSPPPPLLPLLISPRHSPLSAFVYRQGYGELDIVTREATLHAAGMTAHFGGPICCDIDSVLWKILTRLVPMFGVVLAMDDLVVRQSLLIQLNPASLATDIDSVSSMNLPFRLSLFFEPSRPPISSVPPLLRAVSSSLPPPDFPSVSPHLLLPRTPYRVLAHRVLARTSLASSARILDFTSTTVQKIMRTRAGGGGSRREKRRRRIAIHTVSVPAVSLGAWL